MSNQAPNGGSNDQRSSIESIKLCLDQLCDEASERGLSFPALLIGVAAEAVSDELATLQQEKGN